MLIRARQSPTATWLTVKEAAEYLGGRRSPDWIRKRIHSGDLVAVKIGDEVWLIRRISLDLLLYRLRNKKAAGH